MDAATLDLVLAILHHLSIFALFGVLVAELLLIRKDMAAGDIRRLAGIDIWYGVLAGVILVVGFSRAIFAAKGWAYYSHNLMFHAKIGAFITIGLLSIWPTIEIIKWKRALKSDAGALPAAGRIGLVRRLLWIEAGLFALLPIFAAAMARGYGG
jgi:putative membrane protein